MTGPAARFGQIMKGRGGGLLVDVLVNVVLPYMIYTWLHEAVGDVKALMASSGPPIVWALVEFARVRRLDFISVFVLATIGVSLLAYVAGGGVKALQLRERLITFSIGVAFLISALINRPLIYYFARAGMQRSQPEKLADFDARRTAPGFKRVMRRITLVWGAGLVLEACLSTVLVFRLTIAQYLIVGPILGYGVMGALALWTFLYVRERERRRDAAEKSAP